MKKYYKPISKEIFLDMQDLLAGSLDKDSEGIDGGEVGAKRMGFILIDDDEEE